MPAFRWGVGIEGSAIPHLGVSQYEWTGHDRRWRSDFETIRAALGPCWLRYPIPWEQVQPGPGEAHWDEVEERLEYAAGLGLKVVAGLVHFGTPTWLPQAFGDPDFPHALAEYAEAFACRLDPLVRAYVPVNEPLVTALFAGDVGLWPPFGRGWRSYACVLGRIAAGLV
ncbi:MAG: dTDP-4-dehydrorhamnose reductase, partial [Gemmatimonadota bacterium]